MFLFDGENIVSTDRSMYISLVTACRLKEEELEYLLLQVKEGAKISVHNPLCTIQKHVLLLLLCLESFYVLTL